MQVDIKDIGPEAINFYLTAARKATEIPVRDKRVFIGDIFAGKCPSCGLSINSQYNYCYECGQKLNWRKEDE